MTKNRISITKYAPIALFIAILASTFGALAGTTNVTLAWNANTETNLAGYRVYYGTATGVYSASKLVGAAVTSTTISNLTSGQTYYFAAKATNTAGMESAFSTEVAYTAPSAPNTAPVAIAQSLTTAEDTAKAVTLTGTDADGNALTFSIVSSTTHGALSGTLPNITYTPTANFNGSDSFTFRANDGTTNSATATVSITVTPVNDAPAAIAQSVSTPEDTAKAITLAGTDVDGNALTYTIVASPANGTLSGSGASRTYTPTANYSGSDSFTFKVNDGTVDSGTVTVSISVTAANDAPIASAQSVTTAEDIAKAVTLTASDLDGNALTYTIVTSPTQGTLTGTAPNVTYKPATNYSGSDSFTFRVNDGTTNSAAATVSIVVTAVNDAPLAVAQSVATPEDSAKAITLAGSDADGDSLTYTLVAAPTHGSLSGTAPNVTYTPATNYSGSDSFTFKANDGTVDSAAATVSINVTGANDTPVAIAQNVTATEDTAKAITLAATDADGNALTYTVTASPTRGTLSGTAPNLTFTPTANYNGSDSFTFKANDGTVDSSPATVSITISAVNDAPLASAQSVAATEDTAKAITLAGSDADGDALTYSIVTSPTQGSLSGTAPNVTYTPTANYSGSDSFTFKANDGTVDSAVATVSITVSAANDAPLAVAQSVTATEDTAKAITLSATDADGNALTYTVTAAPSHGALSGTAPNLTYTPTANYNGSDSFAFKVNDGTVDSGTATVLITVSSVNDTPLAIAQSVATDKNVAASITLTGSDEDGDTVTFAVVTQPTKGTLSGTAPNLTYTPNFNVIGTDLFTFKANDGTADSAAATVAININAGPNTAPVASSQDVTTTEDAAKAITLTATDVDGDALNYTVTTGPAHGTLTGTAPNLTYTPTTNYSGSDSFWFRANDGSSNSAQAVVSITVNAVNDAPLASAQSIATVEDTAKAITLAGSDVDGDSLTYTVVAAPAHGTLSGSGANLTYTPATNYTGSDSFTFKANDGTADSATATVSISVTPANDAPLASAQSTTTAEDTAKAITLSGTDADGNTLTYTVVAQPAHGTLSGTAPNVSYKPATNYNGSDSFTFKVNDGTVDSSAATVSITVSAVNDAPVASAQSVAAVEDTAKAITLAGSDADSDALTFAVVTQPTKGTLSGTAPNVTYTPATNYSGSDSFTFKANDGTVDSTTVTVSINVSAANDAPLAVAQNVTATEDTAKAITLAATDADGNTLTYTATANPAHGALSGTAPNLTYTPTANYNGSDSFSFKANDGTVDSGTATVSIAVSAVNDAPLASAQSAATDKNVAKAITLAGSDADGDTLTFAVVTQPTKGTLSGTAPNLTYTPNFNVIGNDAFTFKANDGTTDSAAATVAININAGPNTAPVASSQDVTATEDVAKPITLTATDVDGDVLNYTVTTAPAHGALSGTAPNLTYTPATNYSGSDSFWFRANDGSSNSALAVVSITVNAANDAPLATSQSIATVEDTAKAITLAGSDVDGNALTYAIVASPAHGTLSGSGANLTYTPATNYSGSDSFTFKANDGVMDSTAATVSITVTPANDAPLASAQSATTAEDTVKAITLGGSDADGNALTYTVVAQPAHGTLSGTAPNVSYKPATNYNGSDSFTFKVNDATVDSSAATVSITVTAANDAPIASSQSVATDKNVAKTVTLAGSDVDGDTLNFAVVTQPTKGTLSGTAPNLTYTPNNNVIGADSFTFKANDGTADSAVATVAINIAAGPNTAPVADAQNVTATEDTAKTITLTATDVDGDALTYAVTTAPAHGTLSGTAPNLIYTPVTNYNGSDSFWFRANDDSSNSALAVVSITVNPANDAPLATSQSFTTVEDTAKAITLAGSDLDGDTLTFTVTVPPSHGTLSGTGATRTYTPATNYNGSDSFSFKANDGIADSTTATVTIVVTPGTDIPMALGQNVAATEDITKAITLSGSDVDGNALTYAIVAQPAHGTLSGTAPNVSYKPATNYNGSDSFTFKANNGALDSSPATVSITVAPANDAPLATEQSVATDKNVAKAITLAGSDLDGDTLTFTVATQPTKGTLSGTAPNLTYTPNNNITGADVFTFKANDGTVDSAAAAVYININAGPNTAPVADAQDVTTTEDTAKAVTLSASDTDGNAITYSIVTPPAHGTLSGTAPNLTFTPTADFSGSDTFWFKASDGSTNSVPAVVSITITSVNDTPTLDALANMTLGAGSAAQTVALSGITAGSNESQPLTVTVDSSNPGLIPTPTVAYTTPNATGSLSFSPVASGSGTAIVSVTVDDGQSQNSSVTRTFTVTVNASNATPTIALTSPTSSDSFTAPAVVHLAASVSATGHTVTKVQFFGSTNLLGEDSSAPYEFDWNAANAGSYSVVARLVYDGSSTVDSAPVTVSVTDLPGPWAAGDIGNVVTKGDVSVADGIYTVEGAGVLASTTDSFRFVRQPLSADGEIKVRINSLDNTGKDARAGVMIRESLTPGSKYAFIGVSSDGYFRWQSRNTTSGGTATTMIRGDRPGAWIRLVRKGKTITSYRSYDGTTWTRIGSANVSMAANIHVGIAVASGSPLTLNTSKFASPAVVP